MRKLASAVVADDNRISRIIFREVLDQFGVTVYEAADGEEAFSLIAEHGPDLVISDLLMPKLDGFALATKIMTEGVEPRPVLFMVSAVYKTRQWRNEAHLTYEADEFLPKPVKPEDLEAALRRHFQLDDAP